MIHKDFVGTIDRVSKELYPDVEWKNAEQDHSVLKVELMFMRSHVFDVAFERHPEVFEGLNWVQDDDDSIPLWIRPGKDDDWAAAYLPDNFGVID